MKVRIIQTDYTFDSTKLEEYFNKSVALMEECNEPLDVIVMPEYCDVPAAQTSKKGYFEAFSKYNAPIMEKAKEMAKRCHSNVFINCAYLHENGYRNTTHVIDREGNVIGRYYKAHPAPKEDKPESVGGTGMDSSYSVAGELPYTIEVEGVKYGFLTCYDFYLYELLPRIALENVDVIIGCSHQRTDTHQALEIINRYVSYNTNAYLVRASVSLGEDSLIGGCSCIIAPNGDVLVDMKSKVGFATCEIDPKQKYYKAAGFGGAKKAPKSHYEYIEDGRRPWLYRNGGASIVKFNALMPYPRVCADGGIKALAPENTLPSIASAISLGANEVMIKISNTLDGVLVCTKQNIADKTYAQLLENDIPASVKGIKIPTLEEVLKKSASQAIFNLVINAKDISSIPNLLKRYDCENHCYFTFSDKEQLKEFKAKYPKYDVCLKGSICDAIELGVDKIQVSINDLTDDLIKTAKDNSIKINCEGATEENAKCLIEKGVDTLITENSLEVSQVII